MRNLTPAFQALNTEKIGFKLKIKIGENYWTKTQTVKHQKKRGVYVCEFGQIIRFRVNLSYASQAVVSLTAVQMDNEAESQTIPDEFQSLKTEFVVGFTKINVEKLVETKNPMWVPLNNGICFENPSMLQDGAMLSMNFRLIETSREFPRNSIVRKKLEYRRNDLL